MKFDAVPDFIQAGGQGNHRWTRTLIVLAMVVVLMVAGSLLAQLVLWPSVKAALIGAPDAVKSAGLSLMIAVVFGAALAGLLTGVTRVHRRPLKTLFTSASHFRSGQMAIGFALTAILLIAEESWQQPGVIGVRLHAIPPAMFIATGLIMLAAFAVQATTEELFFRGWLVQVGARGFGSVPAAAAFSIALFTLGHAGYGIETAVFTLISAAGVTLIVLMLGGLEFAIGNHIANNWVTVLLFENLADANKPSAGGFDWARFASDTAVIGALVVAAWLIRRRASR